MSLAINAPPWCVSILVYSQLATTNNWGYTISKNEVGVDISDMALNYVEQSKQR